MPGAKPGRQLLRQEVVEGIKRYILEKRLRPGDALPTEPALCEALGASRSSVREAVKILDALDIVDVRHGHGTYVGRLSLSALVESLTFRGLLSPDDDFQVMADLVDVRELFERGMADRIVSLLSEEQLDALDGLVTTMRRTGAQDGHGFVEADRAFHALLVAPLGNELIGQLSMAFWDVYSIVAPHLDGFTHADEKETIAAHQNIVDAARAGDVTGFMEALGEHYAPLRRRISEARARDDARS
ncbi:MULTISPECIES: FCD domain-containing protein [unclassified Streptomyces]|uniref:FadR/GntR family transcriptional regulator n=1 Tax=unclassified Streptomyces TaxID=2593676 RepID=UPI002E79F1C7|nr:FCD domain-containing protein [Streptomyces sp. JV190]MEE1845487.1 FCD domain-containing protein [Streptomyces sp. JV190]